MLFWQIKQFTATTTSLSEVLPTYCCHFQTFFYYKNPLSPLLSLLNNIFTANNVRILTPTQSANGHQSSIRHFLKKRFFAKPEIIAEKGKCKTFKFTFLFIYFLKKWFCCKGPIYPVSSLSCLSNGLRSTIFFFQIFLQKIYLFFFSFNLFIHSFDHVFFRSVCSCFFFLLGTF